MLIIGAVGFIDMGLKAYVFTAADQEDYYYSRPIVAEGSREITAEKDNQENQETKNNYIRSQRHREAARDLSLIIVGLPLFLIHWNIIRKESRA